MDNEDPAGAVWLAFFLLASFVYMCRSPSSLVNSWRCCAWYHVFLVMIAQGSNNNIRSQCAMVCFVYWMTTCAMLLHWSASSACISLRLLFAYFPNANASSS